MDDPLRVRPTRINVYEAIVKTSVLRQRGTKSASYSYQCVRGGEVLILVVMDDPLRA